MLKLIETADPINTTAKPKPYSGVQYAGIPEFQAIGTQVGQMIAAALTGQMPVEQALQAAQSSTERTMREPAIRNSASPEPADGPNRPPAFSPPADGG